VDARTDNIHQWAGIRPAPTIFSVISEGTPEESRPRNEILRRELRMTRGTQFLLFWILELLPPITCYHLLVTDYLLLLK